MENYKNRVETRSPNVSKRFLIDPFLNFIKPSAYIESVQDIDTFALKEQGKKLIICDLDNTLVPHFTKYPTKLAFDFVERASEAGLEFVLFSNNTSKRVSFFAEILGVKRYIAGAKKPYPFKLRKLIEELNFSIDETVLIGDMIIMDM
jgi:HAD superfamily phosphatase (TIGR01668 family)